MGRIGRDCRYCPFLTDSFSLFLWSTFATVSSFANTFRHHRPFLRILHGAVYTSLRGMPIQGSRYHGESMHAVVKHIRSNTSHCSFYHQRDACIEHVGAILIVIGVTSVEEPHRPRKVRVVCTLYDNTMVDW
ncbi:hypothetical protein Tcan_01540, partial [Toxocara canis]